MQLSHLFPFLRNLGLARDTSRGSVAGFYAPVRHDSDSAFNQTFEATQGPPSLNLVGTTGFYLPGSPGPEPVLAILEDRPLIEILDTPTFDLLQVGGVYGPGHLIDTPDSAPESQIF